VRIEAAIAAAIEQNAVHSMRSRVATISHTRLKMQLGAAAYDEACAGFVTLKILGPMAGSQSKRDLFANLTLGFKI
jgi:hypothetical protein